MDWHAEVTAEFTRRHKTVDDGVVEEMARHAEAAYEAARADGLMVPDAAASVRAPIRGAVLLTDTGTKLWSDPPPDNLHSPPSRWR